MASRHLLIDPFVIGLMNWLPSLTRRRGECSIAQRAVAVLLEEDRFPTRDKILDLLRQAANAEYSVVDIQNMLRIVAETEPFFENHTGVDMVAASEFSIDPPGALSRLSERLQAVSQNTLVVAAMEMADGRWRGGVYWATTSWPFDPRWL